MSDLFLGVVKKIFKEIMHFHTLYDLYGVEKKIFKEIHQFYTFYPQITPPPFRVGGHETN